MNPSSTDRAPKRTFHDLVRQAFERPQVRLVVDLADFDTDDMTNLFDSDASMIKVLARYARSFGALVDTKVYYPPTDDDAGLQTRVATQAMVTDLLDYLSALHTRSIFIVASTHPALHNMFAEVCAAKGNVVILLGKDSRDNAVVAQHDLVFYMPVAKLSNHGEKVDLENYDFEKFIRLLLTSEQKMPFVGVKYFINKVMWRLGPGHSDPTVCQEIFQAARDKGIIEMGKSDNVNPNAMPVSSCQADRTNELVQKVLSGMQEGDGDREFSNRMDFSNVDLNSLQEDDEDPEQGA